MASVGAAASSTVAKSSRNDMTVDKLPEEINEMKIRDEKVINFGLIIIFPQEITSLFSFPLWHFIVFFSIKLHSHFYS